MFSSNRTPWVNISFLKLICIFKHNGVTGGVITTAKLQPNHVMCSNLLFAHLSNILTFVHYNWNIYRIFVTKATYAYAGGRPFGVNWSSQDRHISFLYLVAWVCSI
jgi:hypothetical protein